MNETVIQVLNELSGDINTLYGYVATPGENFGEPAINSGPCAPFAYAFYRAWNAKFSKKVVMAFVMVKESDECWHTLIRLPNGALFDGGFGVHDAEKYSNFNIEYMDKLNMELLEKRAYGLERGYPRYCSNFSLSRVTGIINKYLERINAKDI